MQALDCSVYKDRSIRRTYGDEKIKVTGSRRSTTISPEELRLHLRSYLIKFNLGEKEIENTITSVIDRSGGLYLEGAEYMNIPFLAAAIYIVDRINKNNGPVDLTKPEHSMIFRNGPFLDDILSVLKKEKEDTKTHFTMTDIQMQEQLYVYVHRILSHKGINADDFGRVSTSKRYNVSDFESEASDNDDAFDETLDS